MTNALNDRQRRFAELVAAGKPAQVAYEEAGYKPGINAERNAARLKGNEGVSKLIAELRAKTTKALDYEREDVAKFYHGLIISESERTCDRINAAEKLCKLQGWNEPEKRQLSVDEGLAAMLRDARKDGGT